MLKLSFLLIGADAFRERWHALALLGGLLILLALLLAIDALDGVTLVAHRWLSVLLIVNGILSLLLLAGRMQGAARKGVLMACGLLVLLGLALFRLPARAELALAAVFGLAFALDGLARIGTALLLRFSGWRLLALGGGLEVLLALLSIAGWPLRPSASIPFCVALMLALSGALLVRMGLMFRTLESEAAILNLPIFAARGWYEAAPVLVGEEPASPPATPLTVRVWTPVGSAVDPERRLLIDRYVAAVDGKGVISTGHAALEMPPDLYISHYRASDADRSVEDFIGALRATPDNDMEGLFQPSYAVEAAAWCPADQRVDLRRYSPRRLRAFWAGYRQDATYNLTNRNCSVVVAHALEAALEGSLPSRRPWLRLLGLLANPDIWVAALIRARATSATWTPGLVLDYARTLRRIVEPDERSLPRRLGGFLRRLGR